MIAIVLRPWRDGLSRQFQRPCRVVDPQRDLGRQTLELGIARPEALLLPLPDQSIGLLEPSELEQKLDGPAHDEMVSHPQIDRLEIITERTLGIVGQVIGLGQDERNLRPGGSLIPGIGQEQANFAEHLRLDRAAALLARRPDQVTSLAAAPEDPLRSLRGLWIVFDGPEFVQDQPHCRIIAGPECLLELGETETQVPRASLDQLTQDATCCNGVADPKIRVGQPSEERLLVGRSPAREIVLELG